VSYRDRSRAEQCILPPRGPELESDTHSSATVVRLDATVVRILAAEVDAAFATHDRVRFEDALRALVDVALRAPDRRS
jgi:hypothetical protein